MSTHQYNSKMLPDSEFLSGSTKYLLSGNHCRRLDNRRTPGVIESVDLANGFFRWRIAKFEHKGRFWDVPLEDVVLFQFPMNAKTLADTDIAAIEKLLTQFEQTLSIPITREPQHQTLQEIASAQTEAQDWLKMHSTFFKNNETLNMHSVEGSKRLANDLNAFMQSEGLAELETITADTLVLNPSSGEWIKGMRIILAEMGLMPYQDKIPRSHDIFSGLGAKELRRKYLLHRLAFVWAYFELLNIFEVELYRGMSIEKEWEADRPQSFLSFSFSKEVAESFSTPNHTEKIKQARFLEETIPIKQLFMTYLETEAMNKEYKEAEALVLPQFILDKKR